MATYIILGQWTQKGVENVKQSPDRLEKVKQLMKTNGGQLKAFYLTMGQYDFIAICEMPDDRSQARTVLQLASSGNVRTETLKAFPESEYKEIIGSLS
ncbi:MAG: GYD domain-containing protein [Acidobacteria bacterium]|nr:MAG: GYD domain-containing protein [Acidobacteriota bacterium]RPJ63996.1 MAG: GYD domain-containing protein [Acidobacteriota bacterium]